ncbi:MAG: thioredoxin family protein [Pyrinomonadaceae bacterium]
MSKFFSSKLGSVLFYGMVALALYFGNVELQSFWGRQALANTGLVNVPFADALVRSKTENKPILLDISAIWCSNCRKLDSTVFSDISVKRAINERFIFSRIEYESEEGQKFLESHEVSGFPTVWILNGEGEVIKRVGITFEPSQFMQHLEF